MFNVYINDGSNEIPDDDICYIVAKEGIFLKKRLGIMESIAPVKNISILQSVQSSAKMHIEKIPAISSAKILEFFKAVYDEHKAEAVVLMFYNEETKKYKFIVPPQKVSGAAVDYTKSIQVDNFQMIGTIHSHANFSAFHSGTDSSDEKNFDGLHITFGHVNSDEISISASIVSNGFRVIIDPEEYMIGLEKIQKEKTYAAVRVFRYDRKTKKMVQDTKTTKKNQKTEYELRFKIKCSPSKRKFNPKWMEMVEYKAPVYTTYYGGYGYGKWGQNYNSSYWNQSAWHPRNNKKIPPQNVGVKTTPITFPPHVDDNKPIKHPKDIKYNGVLVDMDDENPCENCTFRNHKIDWALEQADNIEETFQCTKCEKILKFDSYEEEDFKCPQCGTDKFLIDVTDKFDERENVKNNFLLDDEYDYLFEKDKDKDYKCPTCGETIYLNVLEQPDCPFCQSILIPEEAERKEYECPSCHNIMLLDPGKRCVCSFCNRELTEANMVGYGYSKEDELELQDRTDSGEFMEEEEEEIKSPEEILEVAKQADVEKQIRQIPDPSSGINPLSSPLSYIRKRFGRKL
jgi:PRTRC genetic system protein A